MTRDEILKNACECYINKLKNEMYLTDTREEYVKFENMIKDVEVVKNELDL